MASSSSVVRPFPMGPQVFICFHGNDVHNNFISFLVPDLREANINVFTDDDELLGSDRGNLMKRIEESEIALVIFSVDFTSSYWCLDQLAKIKERKDQDRLIVIPIFYKVQLSVVQDLRAQFGDNFRDLTRKYSHYPQRILKWEEALVTIPETKGLPLAEQSDTTDTEFIAKLVIQIHRLLEDMAKRQNQKREAIRQGGTIVSARTPTEVLSSSVPSMEPETETTHQGLSVVPLMVRARELEINNSEDPLKWVWSTINEGPNYEEIEIMTMIKVHWVQIIGKITTDNLTPGTTYEAVFVVKIEDDARGWRKKPVPLKLKVVQYYGNNNQVDRKEYLSDYKGHNWVNILAGNFVVPPKSTPAMIKFTMVRYDSAHYKKCGLVLKGVVIRPKEI